MAKCVKIVKSTQISYLRPVWYARIWRQIEPCTLYELVWAGVRSCALFGPRDPSHGIRKVIRNTTFPRLTTLHSWLRTFRVNLSALLNPLYNVLNNIGKRRKPSTTPTTPYSVFETRTRTLGLGTCG